MTPTEQDKELRESTRKSIALLVAQRRGAVKWDEQDYIAAGNILFVCTKLITADRKRVALEAELQLKANVWVQFKTAMLAQELSPTPIKGTRFRTPLEELTIILEHEVPTADLTSRESE